MPRPIYYAPVSTFGSAEFMTLAELERQNLHVPVLNPGQVSSLRPLLGAFHVSKGYKTRPQLLFAPTDGQGHLLTVAPTRAGKGMSQIIPNLLTWEGSTLVIDVKGENYFYTSGYRKDAGQEVFRFAPDWKGNVSSHCWNPLLCITADFSDEQGSMREEVDVRYLCNLLFNPSGSPNDTFWENSAKNFIEGLILHVRTCNDTPFLRDNRVLSYDHALQWRLEAMTPDHILRERSMYEVRRLLTLNAPEFTKLLQQMAESSRNLIRQSATTMLRYVEGATKMATSILAVALEQTSVWSYQHIHRITYKVDADGNLVNDICFAHLCDQRQSVYIVIPPEALSECRNVLRALVGMAVREIRLRTEANRRKKIQQPPVLCILDEFPQLGYMQPIEESLLYIAGYGVNYWFFIQDLSQLRRHYAHTWQSFLANVTAQSFFGVADLETARYVSDMLGEYTTVNQSTNATLGKGWHNNYTQSDGGSESWDTDNVSNGSSTHWSSTTGYGESGNSSVGVSRSHVGRKLLTPDEVLRREKHEQIVFIIGRKPLLCILLTFKDWGLEARAQIPPPEAIPYCPEPRWQGDVLINKEEF